METVVANLVGDGTRVLVIVSGYWIARDARLGAVVRRPRSNGDGLRSGRARRRAEGGARRLAMDWGNRSATRASTGRSRSSMRSRRSVDIPWMSAPGASTPAIAARPRPRCARSSGASRAAASTSTSSSSRITGSDGNTTTRCRPRSCTRWTKRWRSSRRRGGGGGPRAPPTPPPDERSKGGGKGASRLKASGRTLNALRRRRRRRRAQASARRIQHRDRRRPRSARGKNLAGRPDGIQLVAPADRPLRWRRRWRAHGVM